jgi:hypothetical protein
MSPASWPHHYHWPYGMPGRQMSLPSKPRPGRARPREAARGRETVRLSTERRELSSCPVPSSDVHKCSETLERVTRIELAFSAWEADVLPLNYTRVEARS